MPVVVETIAGLRSHLAQLASTAVAAGLPRPSVSLVPTMGALHEGHLALVERARESADIVVVSIFVNPMQFGAGEDLDRYPRTIDADTEKLDAAGVAVVFAPTAAEMYPTGSTRTTVHAGDVGMRFEGRTRRGHFDGVLTVVAKLLNIVRPDVVVFGEKDAQQVFLVRRMVVDLDIPVTVEAVPTVREDDGLALSSRNRYLDSGERIAAVTLSRALEAAESAADGGVDAVLAACQSVLTADTGVDLDYLAIVSQDTFQPVDEGHRGRALVLVAAKVGDTRLIDNATIYLG